MEKLSKLLIVVILILLLPANSLSLDRCDEFIPDVRAQHIRYFGLQYPWWYGLGQLRQESCCRSTVTAFDAGQGVAQFMPATTKYVRKLMGEYDLDPYNPEHAIRMQAFYMSYLHRQNFGEGKKLWLTYQAYNGGWGNLKKEYKRAGNEQWIDMKNACKRGGVQFKWGYLSFCEVNYDYSIKVYNYGKKYRGQNIDRMKYW